MAAKRPKSVDPDIERLTPIVENIVKRMLGEARRPLTIREFAAEEGIAPTTVYDELNAGRLEAVKIGAKTLITREAQSSWQAKRARYVPQERE